MSSDNVELWSRSVDFLQQLSNLDNEALSWHLAAQSASVRSAQRPLERLVSSLRSKCIHISAFLPAKDKKDLLGRLMNLKKDLEVAKSYKGSRIALSERSNVFDRVFLEAELIMQELNESTKQMGLDFKLRQDPGKALYD